MVQLTLSDLQLRPPAQLLWIKRHYCPLMLEAITNTHDHAQLVNISKSQHGGFVWGANMLTITYRMNYGDFKTIHGDAMEHNEFHIRLSFHYPWETIERDAKPYEVNIALEDMHLIPYLFKIAEVQVKRSEGELAFDALVGIERSPWVTKKAIVAVAEHWMKLISIGFLPNDLYSISS